MDTPIMLWTPVCRLTPGTRVGLIRDKPALQEIRRLF
jgi:hypothetical protein